MISNSGYVIEFQHSPLSLPERLERESHYKDIIWVVHSDRTNSKTWRQRTRAKVVFNGGIYSGLEARVYWKSWGQRTFEITKEKFIKIVINNPHYTDGIFNTIESRQQIRLCATLEYYNKKTDERGTIPETEEDRTFFRWKLKSDYYTAAFYIIKEFEKLEKYHDKLESDRIRLIASKREAEESLAIQARAREYARLKQIKETKAALLKEQRMIRDPALLQELLKSERDCAETALATEKAGWVLAAGQDLLNRNHDLYEAKLLLEHEHDLELAKQINTEIINNHTKQLSKEMQERIRVDLIRVKSNIQYAADTARERLARLGIDCNNETGQITYGVGTK